MTTPVQHPRHDTHDPESPRVTVAWLDWDVVTVPQLAAFQPDIVIAAGTAQPRPLEQAAAPSSQLRGGDTGGCAVGQ